MQALTPCDTSKQLKAPFFFFLTLLFSLVKATCKVLAFFLIPSKHLPGASIPLVRHDRREDIAQTPGRIQVSITKIYVGTFEVRFYSLLMLPPFASSYINEFFQALFSFKIHAF
jgi:hypothetical protein